MVKSSDKLATALQQLELLQKDGTRVFASDQLTRTSRERLVRNGFLQDVMNGWLISSSPHTQPGDTTPWFASFWEFCARYCNDRFGTDWHLSPEQSLLLHSEHSAVPRQVIVWSPSGNNSPTALPFETSLFFLRQKATSNRDVTMLRDLRVFTVEAALVRAQPTFFVDHPVEAQLALGGIRDPSGLLERLLDGGHTVIAGRLAGAFRRLGRGGTADEIVKTMKAADHAVREHDPFEDAQPVVSSARQVPAIVARIQALWSSARDVVLAEAPKPPSKRSSVANYLERIDEVYRLDAYHSLSIEGYRVTPELIDQVATGTWEPEASPHDRAAHDALAARGYWLAFQRVRETVARILGRTAERAALRAAHRDWYRELFAPHVAVGLLTPASLAGYRTAPVYLRGSRHVPPRSEVVGDAMHSLFDLVEVEPEPFVRAVLAHWLVGYIHPFADGNGRTARFLMNVLLAEAGYAWTVIRVEDRARYLEALESASVDTDVRPFARFVAAQMKVGKVPAHTGRKATATPKRLRTRPRRR